jgi:hypothetical protein
MWLCDLGAILRKILPSRIEVPTKYTFTGHIAYLKLNKTQLPFKHLIGEVFLEVCGLRVGDHFEPCCCVLARREIPQSSALS